jgi:RimJ/RimL family protein N-acetyltransferase
MNHWQPAQFPGPVTLTGRWVVLEPLSALRHAHALWQAVQGHDEVWTWLSDGPYVREEDLAAALAVKETGAAARFLAIRPVLPSGQPGGVAGYASFMRIDTAHGVIEVGNVLFSPALQRTPAATEAMYLMARHVFEELGFRRYEWKCNALNLPSRRAAERFGFTFEGVFRQHMVIKGKSRDTAWFAMLDKEWAARKAAFEAWLAPENFDADGRQKHAMRSFSSAGGAILTDECQGS